jgi:hypothetical protein
MGHLTLLGAGKPPAAGAFTPASLSPALWIEAATSALFQSNAGTTAATANSDPVGFVTDKSGNAFNLTSLADDTTRPLLQGVGVHPYLDFDGTNDFIGKSTSLGMYAAGACSVFAAIKTNPASASGLYLVSETANASSPIIAYMEAKNSAPQTTATVFLRNDGAVALTGANQGDITQALAFNNTDRVYGVIDDGSTITPYLDGVTGTGGSYTRSGVFTPTRFGLGALNRTTVASFITTRVYALVVVNRAIDSTERANLTTYLGNLAGLTL